MDALGSEKQLTVLIRLSPLASAPLIADCEGGSVIGRTGDNCANQFVRYSYDRYRYRCGRMGQYNARSMAHTATAQMNNAGMKMANAFTSLNAIFIDGGP